MRSQSSTLGDELKYTLFTLAVSNTLFLGFWTAQSIPGFSQGHYMGVYAALGAAQAIFTFIMAFSFTYVVIFMPFE